MALLVRVDLRKNFGGDFVVHENVVLVFKTGESHENQPYANVFACILLLVSSPTWAVEYSHTSTVAILYPTYDGNFAVGFDTNSSNCFNASSPIKFHYVAVGSNNVAADGAKKMYAALLLALSTRLTVTIHFDGGSGNTSCFINRLSIVPEDD